MKKWLCAILVVAVLVGCTPKSSAPATIVVSSIFVSYPDNGVQIRHRYTTQHKMRQILNHIRLLGQKYTPILDPDTLRSTVFEIRLSFSDGSQRIYHTRSDRYIRTNNGPWQQTDPQRLQALNELLLSLPEDEN